MHIRHSRKADAGILRKKLRLVAARVGMKVNAPIHEHVGNRHAIRLCLIGKTQAGVFTATEQSKRPFCRAFFLFVQHFRHIVQVLLLLCCFKDSRCECVPQEKAA